jgi:hypothetical protein
VLASESGVGAVGKLGAAKRNKRIPIIMFMFSCVTDLHGIYRLAINN